VLKDLFMGLLLASPKCIPSFPDCPTLMVVQVLKQPSSLNFLDCFQMCTTAGA